MPRRATVRRSKVVVVEEEEEEEEEQEQEENAFVHRVAETEPTGGHASLDSRQPTIKI